MSGSGEKKSNVGDAGWNWWLVLARVLLAITCIPVSLIFYEAWTFDVESSDLERVGYDVRVYLLVALCMLTIAGIAIVFHTLNSDRRRSNGGAGRLFWMKASEVLIFAAVFVTGSLATFFYYSKTDPNAYVRGMGEVVYFVPQEGDEMSTINPDTSQRAVELWISGEDATHVQRGDRVRLQFAGWPVVESAGLFRGRVETVYPLTSDGKGRLRILVKENDNDSWPDKRYLRPGVGADGWVLIESR